MMLGFDSPLRELRPQVVIVTHEPRFYTGSFLVYRAIRPDGLTVARITRSAPRWLSANEAANITPLDLLAGRGVTFPPISRTHFERAYRASLTRTGIARIGRELSALHARHHRSVLLLGWGGEWCHRRLFAAWWEEQTGEQVPEYSFTITPPVEEPPERQLVLV